MEIKAVRLSDIKPYEKNPRKNTKAVGPVAESIRQFGFRVPIVLDRDGVIVCGHTRYLAAQKLGMEEVPCIYADDLTPAQIKAFRLVDNKTQELAEWDFDLLSEELDELADFADLDLPAFGFPQTEEKHEQVLDAGQEIDTEDFADEKFECTCPRCGFKFNK